MIFSRAFLLISNKFNLDYPDSLEQVKTFGQFKFVLDRPLRHRIRTGAVQSVNHSSGNQRIGIGGYACCN